MKKHLDCTKLFNIELFASDAMQMAHYKLTIIIIIIIIIIIRKDIIYLNV